MGWNLVLSVRGLGLAAVFSWLASCAAPPDVGAFAAATGELSQSIRATGTAVGGTLEGMRGSAAATPGDPASRWAEAWKTRTSVMDHLVDYADSLVALHKASVDADDAVKSVAQKLGALATAAGIADPTLGAGSAVAVATDVAAFVWKQIALARGASTMRRSVEAAHPAILRIADVVVADLRDARKIVRGASENLRGRLESDPDYSEAAGFRAQVDKTRLEMFRTPPKDWSAKQVTRLAELDAIGAAADRTMKSKGDELRALDASEKAQLDLIGAAGDAITAWAAAHGRLLAALRDHRPVTLDSLEQAALELRALIKKVRDA